MAVNPWDGSAVNANVAKIVLESKLGTPTELVDLDENASWVGLDAGDLDANLEIWPSGHAADRTARAVQRDGRTRRPRETRKPRRSRNASARPATVSAGSELAIEVSITSVFFWSFIVPVEFYDGLTSATRRPVADRVHRQATTPAGPCRRRQKKYESDQSTPVPGATPFQSRNAARTLK